jgi:hypothetical protein
MSWFSSITTLTSWVTTIFVWRFLISNLLLSYLCSSQFYLALLIITPWLLALAYDLLLYTWRSLTYDIPVIGGRARGVNPPRAPTLTARTDGATRTPPVDLAEQVAARAEEVVSGTDGAPVTQKLRRRAEKVLRQTD